MNDLVSIIIPLYNKGKYIEKTIENIKEQTYKNWEVIIIDDGSTDDGYEKAQKYENSKIKIIRNTKNMGASRARNLGLELAKGKYICFQDADDLWDIKKLEKQINFMNKKQCAFSYTSFHYMKENGCICNKVIKIQPELNYNEALKNIRILTISTMFDTDKINKELLYMPNVASEDIATWWNILKKGYTAYGIEEGLVFYRQVPKSLTSNKLKSAKNRWNLYRKYEKISWGRSICYLFFYSVNAVIKRI